MPLSLNDLPQASSSPQENKNKPLKTQKDKIQKPWQAHQPQRVSKPPHEATPTPIPQTLTHSRQTLISWWCSIEWSPRLKIPLPEFFYHKKYKQK